MSELPILHGVVHGNVIQLDCDAGLPAGQHVTVIVQPQIDNVATGKGLERAFGGWAEDAEELDRFLEWNRQRRKSGRRELEEWVLCSTQKQYRSPRK